MRNKIQNLLIMASSFLLAGVVVFTIAMSVLKWDFSKLSSTHYEMKEYEVEETFSHISIEGKSADVAFVVSENSKTKVVCDEREKMKYLVEVNDGTLTVKLEDKRKWYDFAGFDFYSPKKHQNKLCWSVSVGAVTLVPPERFNVLSDIGGTQAVNGKL